MTEEYRRGYLNALSKIKESVGFYAEAVSNQLELEDEEVEVMIKTCYDMVDIIESEIISTEEF